MQKCEGCGAYFSDFDKYCPHCGRKSDLVPQEEESPVPDQADKPAEIHGRSRQGRISHIRRSSRTPSRNRSGIRRIR